jgi:hypothetical protein
VKGVVRFLTMAVLTAGSSLIVHGQTIQAPSACRELPA